MHKRAAIWALAVTQTLGYACLYYIFAALVVQWSADLGWSKTTLALGPSLAITLASCAAPFAGRLIDRGWSRALLVGGSVVGGIALCGLAVVNTPAQYYGAWAVLGLAQASALYEVCFAFLIRRLGGAARAAIIRVTLVAGFASTLAFPVAALVSDAYGWRAVVWLAAGVVLSVQAPLNFWAVSVIRRGEVHDTADETASAKAALRRALRSGRFWLLGSVLALLSLNHWMLTAFVIPMFADLGASTGMAVLAASLVGPAQVAGRFVLMRFDATFDNWQVLRLCLGGMAVGVGALWLAGAAAQLVLVFALAQGAAIGVMTILRPVLIAQVMGQAGYGAIAGSIQVMPLMAGAAAPLVGGVLFGVGGAAALIWASAALITLGFAGTAVLRRL